MKEVSNKTLAILIISSLLVTVIGTWIILEKFETVKPMHVATSTTSSGELSIEVIGPKVKGSKSSGQISVNIVDQDNI